MSKNYFNFKNENWNKKSIEKEKKITWKQETSSYVYTKQNVIYIFLNCLFVSRSCCVSQALLLFGCSCCHRHHHRHDHRMALISLLFQLNRQQRCKKEKRVCTSYRKLVILSHKKNIYMHNWFMSQLSRSLMTVLFCCTFSLSFVFFFFDAYLRSDIIVYVYAWISWALRTQKNM